MFLYQRSLSVNLAKSPPIEAFERFQQNITPLLIVEGFSSEEIMEAIDLPPEGITPATPEYVDWWNKELSDPDWKESVLATLEILSDTQFPESLTAEKSSSYTVSWSDFKMELGL